MTTDPLPLLRQLVGCHRRAAEIQRIATEERRRPTLTRQEQTALLAETAALRDRHRELMEEIGEAMKGRRIEDLPNPFEVVSLWWQVKEHEAAQSEAQNESRLLQLQRGES